MRGQERGQMPDKCSCFSLSLNFKSPRAAGTGAESPNSNLRNLLLARVRALFFPLAERWRGFGILRLGFNCGRIRRRLLNKRLVNRRCFARFQGWRR